MIEIREETKEFLEMGIPMAIGALSAGVINTAIKANVDPEKTGLLAKVAWRIGVWGITTTVSSAVCRQFESEVEAVLNAWNNVSRAINNATAKPSTLSSEDIAKIKAEVYNERNEGPVQPQGIEADAE